MNASSSTLAGQRLPRWGPFDTHDVAHVDRHQVGADLEPSVIGLPGAANQLALGNVAKNDVVVDRQARFDRREYATGIFRARVVIDDPPGRVRLGEAVGYAQDLVDDHVGALRMGDEIRAETRIARQNDAAAGEIDAIAERGLYMLTVVDVERGYAHAIALVDDAFTDVRCLDRDSRWRQMLVDYSYPNVFPMSLLEVRHHVARSARTVDAKTRNSAGVLGR